MMSLPIVYLSTCGLISTLEAPWLVFNQATAISLSMSDVTNDSFIFHLLKVRTKNDIFISCSCDDDISISTTVFNFN
jgi:hypothetical protein